MKRSNADLAIISLQILSLLEKSQGKAFGTTKSAMMDGLLRVCCEDDDISLKKASSLVKILLGSDLMLPKVSKASYAANQTADGNDADAETDEEATGGKDF